MTAYYITLLIAFVTSYGAHYADRLGRSQKGTYNIITKTLLFLTAFTLVFTAGLRYKVGTDYGAYYDGLNIFGSRLKEAVRYIDEPFLPILANLIKFYTNDGAYFIFICSLLTISLLLHHTYHHSDQFVFCTLLFVFTGNWHGSFNGVRQFLAAAMIFAGHRLILEKKFWKYAIVVFIAFCVHRSAIIMIVPYFLFRNKITLRNVTLLLLGTYILGRNYDSIFSFIGLLKDTNMSMTDIEYYSTTVNIFRVLVFCAPAVTVLIFFWRIEKTTEQTYYINALLANAAAMLATSNSAYLARLSIYTNVFTPLALAKLFVFRNRTLQFTLRVIVVVLYGLYWAYEISISSSLSDFQWIWER